MQQQRRRRPLHFLGQFLRWCGRGRRKFRRRRFFRRYHYSRIGSCGWHNNVGLSRCRCGNRSRSGLRRLAAQLVNLLCDVLAVIFNMPVCMDFHGGYDRLKPGIRGQFEIETAGQIDVDRNNNGRPVKRFYRRADIGRNDRIAMHINPGLIFHIGGGSMLGQHKADRVAPGVFGESRRSGEK